MLLAVTQSLPVGATPQTAADIRDIKPLIAMGYPWWLFAVAGGLLLLAVIALLLWWQRKKAKENPVPAIPPKSPREILFDALKALESASDWSPDGERRWHFVLSEVVRAYIEARFGIFATDMTSAELLRALSPCAELADPDRAFLRAFMNTNDRVKFAKATFGKDAGMALLEKIRDFVCRMSPLSAAPAEPTNPGGTP